MRNNNPNFNYNKYNNNNIYSVTKNKTFPNYSREGDIREGQVCLLIDSLVSRHLWRQICVNKLTRQNYSGQHNYPAPMG